MVGHRRAIHRHPELAWNEHGTVDYVESVLSDLGIPSRRIVGTGLIAVIEGTGGRTVGIRADMDALPVPEAPGREGYRSVNDGASHACGHDAHTAIALGLAELLSTASDLPGNVVLYFQPAEEQGGGARPMVMAGALDEPTPDAVLALHVAPHHPAGTVSVRSGPVVGSFDEVKLTVKGVGGHAAHPESTIDPIPIAASIVMATQQLVSREIDPMHPAVITYGAIRGGSRANVIGPEVELLATLRALYPETRELLLDRLLEMARGIASAHRATLATDVARGYPAGSNDDALAQLVGAAGARVLGPQSVVQEAHPSLGSEDFFEFGATGIPVCLFRLGVGNSARGITASLHSPEFDLDEAALSTGAAVMAESIRQILTGPSTSAA
jgi:amidohydrolase